MNRIILMGLLCVIIFLQGCVPLVVGGAVGWTAGKMITKKAQPDAIQQELIALEKDYKAGKISADAYWQARAQLVSQSENIATQKDLAKKEAARKAISDMNFSGNKPTVPQKITPIRGGAVLYPNGTIDQPKVIRDKTGQIIGTIEK